MTPTTLTAPAVHIMQPHSSQQQARQGHGDKLHSVQSGSDLLAVVSMCLVKQRARPCPILKCPELLLEVEWGFPDPGAEVGESQGGEIITHAQ